MAKGSNNLSGRRSHGAKPYDSNNSFVKKVATKVTDLIPQRSWISKWFNSSEDNGEMSDSETVEYSEFSEETQEGRAAKRARIRMDVVHPPGTFNIQIRNKSSLNKVDESKEQFLSHDETNEDFLEPLAAGPSSAHRLVSSTPAIQNYVGGVPSHRSDLNSMIPTQDNGAINGADDNSESSESTSGCSSLIPQNNRQEAPSNTSFASSFVNKKRFIDDKLNYTNHLQSPRSLFLDSTTRDSLSSRRPSFNSSIMSNTLERSPSLSSPFYSGNVTFGGANAAGLHKRGRSLFNSNNEYKLKVPRRTSVQVKPSNTADIDSSGISQTAKRILEALEHFSSPIIDAKKIPIRNTTNLDSSKRKREEQMCASPRVGLRHMTRELTVPTVPDLLKIRRRQRLQDTTLAARQIVSAQSGPLLTTPSEYRLRTSTDDDPKFRGKLRAKSKKNPLDEETVEPVNLPTIPLPISTLPRFEIALPQYTKSADRSTDKENSFKFASPIRVTDTTKSLKSINDFTFSNPLNVTEEATKGISYDLSTAKTVSLDLNESIHSTASSPNFMWSGSTAPKLKEKVQTKQNTQEPTVLGVASELKSGSVNDFLSELRKKANGSENERNSTPENERKSSESTKEIKVLNSLQPQESWECSECLIRNDSTTHCISCKSSKSGLKAKEPPRVSGANTIQPKPIENDCFGSQFKLSTDQWECSACMIRNKQSEKKCVACTTPRPAGKLTDSGQDLDLMKKFKPAGDSWECPGCMVRNNGNIMTCPCCNAAKPSSKGSPKKETSQEHTLKLNNKSIEGFKPSKSTWECPCCMVRNAETATVCPCCKAVKPGIGNASLKKPEEKTQGSLQGFGDKFKKPVGVWTCDSCLISNKAEATECVACTTAKPGTQKSISTSGSSLQFSFGVPPKDSGFKFGIDKADAKPVGSGSGFTFGSKAVVTNVEQYSFGIPKSDKNTETPKPTGFTSEPNVTEGVTGFQVNKSSDVVASAVKKSNETDKPAFTFGIPKSDQQKTESSDKIVKTGKVEKFSFGIPTTPAATAIPATTATSPGFKVGSSKSKRPAEDELQGKKTAFEGAPTPSIQTISSSTTSSPFSSTTTTCQTLSSPPSFSFAPKTSVSASTASPATTTTVATNLPPFSNSTFMFSDQSKPSQPATLPSFGVPSASSPTFSFGGNKTAEATAATEKKPPPAFPSTASAPTFGSSATASPFGASEANPPPTFGAGEKTSLFGAHDNKLPAFGESESKTPAFGATDKSTPVFGSSNKAPLFPTATPSFGTSTTASPFGNSTPLFGSNSTPNFGSPKTSNAFPASKPNDSDNPAPSTNLFTFGSSQPASGGFNFAGGNPASSAPAQKPPVFAFGANSNTTQAASTFGGNTFSTTTQAAPAQPSFSFNSPKPEAPSVFGQTAPSTAPLFGAAQTAQGQSQTPFSGAGASNAGFSFGAAAPATPSGGFHFGGMTQQPAPSPAQPSSGFNFNAPNAMSFNFTGGNAPQAFNATPQLQQSQPQRKIKTARRRMTPR